MSGPGSPTPGPDRSEPPFRPSRIHRGRPRPGAGRRPTPSTERPADETGGRGSDAGPEAPPSAEAPPGPEAPRPSRDATRPKGPTRRARANAATGQAAARDDGILIRTRKLTKRYEDLVAVDHLDLEVRAGEIFGLLGPNGAGKTTTILMLLGLSEPTSGEARVVGLDPARHPLEVKRRVGYLPDNAGFYGALSGRANLRYTATLNGLRGPAAEARIDEVLEQVGLTEAADRRSETYSRGMRQRLGIADALVKDPRVLILDEPTMAIDPQGVAEILELVQRLVHDRGLALLLSSHLLEQVQHICDRVGIFFRGRLIAKGPVAELARSLGDRLLTVEVGIDEAGPERVGAAADVLRAMRGVVDVSPDEKTPGRLRLTSERDIRGEAAAALSGAGFRIVHLRGAEASLDLIYRRYVAGETSDGRQD